MAALTILSDFCGLLAAYGAESQQAFEAAYHDILESLQYIGPEAILAVFALGIFLIDLVIPVKASRHLAWIAIAGCVIAEDVAGILGSARADPSQGLATAIPARFDADAATLIGHLSQPALVDVLEGSDTDVDVFAVSGLAVGDGLDVEIRGIGPVPIDPK